MHYFYFKSLMSILILCKSFKVTSNMLENKLREDLERLKKIRAHRGLRHYWGYGC